MMQIALAKILLLLHWQLPHDFLNLPWMQHLEKQIILPPLFLKNLNPYLITPKALKTFVRYTCSSSSSRVVCAGFSSSDPTQLIMQSIDPK